MENRTMTSVSTPEYEFTPVKAWATEDFSYRQWRSDIFHRSLGFIDKPWCRRPLAVFNLFGDGGQLAKMTVAMYFVPYAEVLISALFSNLFTDSEFLRNR